MSFSFNIFTQSKNSNLIIAIITNVNNIIIISLPITAIT
jgi:hypothetical protein